MSFIFEERPSSGSSTQTPPGVTLQYVCSGIESEITVQGVAVSYTSPAIGSAFGVLYRQNIQIERQGHKLYYVTVPYGPKSKSEIAGQFKIRFDTSGGTVHRTNSLETIGAYGDPAFAPMAAAAVTDYKGAIDVQGDTVNGVDVVSPSLKLYVDFRHPLGVITVSQMKNLARYTGCVNEDSFFGFEPGEVLCLGASGEEGSDTETSVSYQFDCSENVSDLTVGDIVGITKQGQDVSWIAYRDAEVDGRAVKRPGAVYIERVYRRIPFVTSFGFG